jgi:lambda repressor-like predicted transcriptional regulator
MTTKVRKRLVKLPPEITTLLGSVSNSEVRDDYVRNLRSAGWTLQAISDAIGVSRERVRQICEMPQSGTGVAESMPVPTPPIVEPRTKKVYKDPSPELVAQILALQPKAQQVRSNSSRFRAEAEEYTRLVNQARLEGTSIYRLSNILGLSPSALRFRLTRYGYMPAPNESSSAVYRPIRKENRVS